MDYDLGWKSNLYHLSLVFLSNVKMVSEKNHLALSVYIYYANSTLIPCFMSILAYLIMFSVLELACKIPCSNKLTILKLVLGRGLHAFDGTLNTGHNGTTSDRTSEIGNENI